MKEEVLIWMYVKCIFWYVHSTVQSNSESEEGVNYQIKVGWMNGDIWWGSYVIINLS